MSDNTKLGPWLRRFLLEHLVNQRNLARNTQRSYRDTLTLLVPFVGGEAHIPVDRLTIIDVTADRVRQFLRHIEETRRCCTATRKSAVGRAPCAGRFVGERSRSISSGRSRCAPFPSRSMGRRRHLSGKAGNGPPLGVTRPGHPAGTARSHPPAVSL